MVKGTRDVTTCLVRLDNWKGYICSTNTKVCSTSPEKMVSNASNCSSEAVGDWASSSFLPGGLSRLGTQQNPGRLVRDWDAKNPRLTAWDESRTRRTLGTRKRGTWMTGSFGLVRLKLRGHANAPKHANAGRLSCKSFRSHCSRRPLVTKSVVMHTWSVVMETRRCV